MSKRFNASSIDEIAQCGCSNKCEGFWGQIIKYTEGKRVLGNGTDLWYTFMQLVFCNGNGKDTEKTAQEIASLLNTNVCEEEEKEYQRQNKKRKKDYDHHSSQKAKDARKFAKLTMHIDGGKIPTNLAIIKQSRQSPSTPSLERRRPRVSAVSVIKLDITRVNVSLLQPRRNRR